MQRARALIQNKSLRIPKHDNGYKNLIKLLTSKGLHLPEISRAICLEKYKISNQDKFPQTSINKIRPKQISNTNRTNHQHINGNIQISKDELIKLSKKIIGILKYVFRAADQRQNGHLDLNEFGYLLGRLGIKVSAKGSELLFRAILNHHNKRYLGFYEFKIALSVNDPLQYIETQKDTQSPAKILRRHIRDYYENVAEAHKANRKKLAEIAWSFFNNDKSEDAMMNIDEFRIGLKYLGLGQMTKSEIDFIFLALNRNAPGRLKKDRFCHQIKKEIPASLGAVVNVKEILYETFERILADYKGQRTAFPMRENSDAIIQKSKSEPLIESEDNKKSKMSIFQRIKTKTKRRKTVKAPVKSAFGSNVAEIAENGREIMDSIINAMANTAGNYETEVRIRTDSAIITADEFKKLFSRPFVMFIF